MNPSGSMDEADSDTDQLEASGGDPETIHLDAAPEESTNAAVQGHEATIITDPEAFLNKIHPDFLDKVHPIESGLVDGLRGVDALSSEDEQSIGRETTRRNKARKCWSVLHKITEEDFENSFVPKMKKTYPHVVAGLEFRKRHGANSLQCLRHVMRKRINLKRLIDILHSTQCCSLEKYRRLTFSKYCGDREWEKVFQLLHTQASNPQLCCRVEEMLTKKKIPNPQRYHDVAAGGFTCSCQRSQSQSHNMPLSRDGVQPSQSQSHPLPLLRDGVQPSHSRPLPLLRDGVQQSQSRPLPLSRDGVQQSQSQSRPLPLSRDGVQQSQSRPLPLLRDGVPQSQSRPLPLSRDGVQQSQSQSRPLPLSRDGVQPSQSRPLPLSRDGVQPSQSQSRPLPLSRDGVQQSQSQSRPLPLSRDGVQPSQSQSHPLPLPRDGVQPSQSHPLPLSRELAQRLNHEVDAWDLRERDSSATYPSSPLSSKASVDSRVDSGVGYSMEGAYLQPVLFADLQQFQTAADKRQFKEVENQINTALTMASKVRTDFRYLEKTRDDARSHAKQAKDETSSSATTRELQTLRLRGQDHFRQLEQLYEEVCKTWESVEHLDACLSVNVPDNWRSYLRIRHHLLRNEWQECRHFVDIARGVLRDLNSLCPEMPEAEEKLGELAIDDCV